MPVVRRYGWHKDVPDPRDRIYLAPQGITGLPEKIDLRHFCSPVEDQGELGSCTANAIAGALECIDNLDGNFTDLSRLFLYYYERQAEGTVNEDSGAFLRDGIKVCATLGSAAESLWPYDIAKFKRVPSWLARRDAKKRRISQYKRVGALHDLLACLATSRPVVFGFTVYESFEGEDVARTGLMPMPDTARERSLGGHAVCAVGYDLITQRLIVRNSWGPTWGDQGYFHMPFDVVRDKAMSDDFWVVYR